MRSALPRPERRNPETARSSLSIHNLVVGGRRTSVRLEPAMWEALQDIARRQRVSVHDLVTEIDREREASNLTAAIRVYIVDFYRAAALHAGHTPADRPPRLRL
jgi:predicted DNA-binding ribbon-helix-helix protein